jgi:putative toxin-antitoxin system antitoxin component (TIGR02293 family)
LSPTDSDNAARLRRVSAIADRVFANPHKTYRWLREESIALDGARPIDLLASEAGAQLVEEELHRIDFGMLA